jgi:hypothetical protein
LPVHDTDNTRDIISAANEHHIVSEKTKDNTFPELVVLHIIRVIKSRRLNWAGHVARTGDFGKENLRGKKVTSKTQE